MPKFPGKFIKYPKCIKNPWKIHETWENMYKFPGKLIKILKTCKNSQVNELKTSKMCQNSLDISLKYKKIH